MLKVIFRKMNQLASTHAGRAILEAVSGDVEYSHYPRGPSYCLMKLFKNCSGLFSNASISVASGYFLSFC